MIDEGSRPGAGDGVVLRMVESRGATVEAKAFAIAAVELPTLVLALSIYAAWICLTLLFGSLPLYLSLPALSILVALHSSYQHEAIHGHPTRQAWLNDLIAYAPLGLFYPYPIYKQSHLDHHDSEELTHPIEDPESYYLMPEDWERQSMFSKALLTFHNTSIGRLLIGPGLALFRLLKLELPMILRGEGQRRRVWAIHFAVLLIVFFWLESVCHFPAWIYLLGAAYPGLSLVMLRSFAEHRPHEEGNERQSAIVEAGPLFRLLFLSNNYHYVHHKKPWLPWYRIRKVYEMQKEKVLRANGEFRYPGYLHIIWRYAFRRKDLPVHPHID